MKITFTPVPNDKSDDLLRPIPAIQSLPEWYKEKSPFVDGSKKQKTFPNFSKNVSVKWCNPFGDALGSGYFILLEQDIEITQAFSGTEFAWMNGGDGVISTHAKEQVDPRLIPPGFDNQPFKFQNKWVITTPKGYSCLFSHPLNRPELPFYTLSGVVETDDYPLVINFPFLARRSFEGVLEKGTPIVQVFPFKRANWESEFGEIDNDEYLRRSNNYFKTITRPYKRLFWQKKSYK